MKRLLLSFLLIFSTIISFAQSWQGKPVVRIENDGQSFLYTFSDSSTAYINKCNVSYIVNMPNSVWVQVGYMYDGSTSRIITASYSAITQPDLASAKILSDTLSAWLRDCQTSGGGISQSTLDDSLAAIRNYIENNTYIQTDSSTITDYVVLASQNAPPGSPTTGDTYLVGNSPSGAWVGHEKDIAEWDGSSWDFTDAAQGNYLYNTANALTYIFRSGNWVQTTGMPALHNGNTISSGLQIGTNNARSLTFETNNTRQGRLDSIGRLHIYNLPTSTDTFVAVTDNLGKFGKIGKSSFLSGVGGGSSIFSALTAASGSNTINNANNSQVWQWNSLTGTGLKLSNSFTGTQSGSILLEVENTGTLGSGQTTTALKITNTKASSSGISNGLDISVGGSSVANGITIANSASQGAGINIASVSSGTGIQMNGLRVNLNSSTEYIQSSSIVYYVGGSKRQYAVSTSTAPFAVASDISGNGLMTIARPNSTTHQIIFGGDMSGSTFRSELTSNNTIRSSGGSLTFTGNTGLAGGFGSFTPTDIMTVYGTNSNVGIGTTTPTSVALLELSSTTKGFLPPRMTTTQRDAMTAVQGLVIFNTTTTKLECYDGTTWQAAW